MIKLKRILFIFFCGCILSACGQKTVQTPSPKNASTDPTAKNTKPEEIALLYQKIYEETAASAPSTHNDTKHFETVQAILQRLEPYGITAIDIENQADMVNAQPMRDFITVLQDGGTAEHTVLVVSAYGRFFEYDLSAKEGSLEVAKTYYQYTDGIFESKSTVTYPTDSWSYTDEGYFIFTGSSSSPESYVLTMSDEPEISAWRVEPLDAQCRAMNRAYLLPIGYQKNNMFLVDWDETDYGCLDFYDLFDRLYPSVYGQSVPYVADKNTTVGAVYQIPESEFEAVISEHFSIDHATLRTKTKYLEDAHVYEYHPRGFYEVEYANLPYPEVISYAENADQTITLLVNAVYPSEGTSRAFTHQVTVRPLGQDSFQYVSNKTLPSKTDLDAGWHTNRLTDSEWETYYGKQSLFTEEEKEELEQEALATVSLGGQTDFFNMADSINMENYDRIEAFYDDYVKKQDSQVTVYHAYNDGSIGAFTFLYRDGHLQTYYVEIKRDNSGMSKITSILGYPYDMIFPRQYPPFGEVVDYTENADGTFRYLSNRIEEKEVSLDFLCPHRL